MFHKSFKWACVLGLIGASCAASTGDDVDLWLDSQGLTTQATYQAESMSKTTGTNSSYGGTNGRLGVVANNNAGYLTYGPYATDYGSGPHTATFRMMVDNNTADNAEVATLDVYDAQRRQVLASRHVYRRDFTSAFGWQDFTLSFTNTSGSRLEFRTYWTDMSWLIVDKITVQAVSTPPPTTTGSTLTYQAEGSSLYHVIGAPGSRSGVNGYYADTNLHAPGFLIYGPYTTQVTAGAHNAIFRMMTDNNTANSDDVVILDVFDATSQQVLVTRSVKRTEFTGAFVFQDFSLAFTSAANHQLEFRVQWLDKAWIFVDYITLPGAGPVVQPPPPPPPPTTHTLRSGPVLLFGDSDSDNGGPTAILQSTLDERLTESTDMDAVCGFNVVVTNLAQGNTPIRQTTGSNDGVVQTQNGMNTYPNASMGLLRFGRNDIHQYMQDNSAAHQQQFHDAYVRAIDAVRAKGALPVLYELHRERNSSYDAAMNSANTIMRNLATQYDIPIVHNGIDCRTDSSYCYMPSATCTDSHCDGSHLNDKGARYLRDQTIIALDNYLP